MSVHVSSGIRCGTTVPPSSRIVHGLGGVAGKHTLCPFCPEAEAGLPTPRICAEIIGGDGHDVLHGKAEVVDAEGNLLTAVFLLAAGKVLDFCRYHRADVAILAEKSPSSGSTSIYDGTFCGRRKKGVGVTAALLIESGIAVFSRHQLADIASISPVVLTGPNNTRPGR